MKRILSLLLSLTLLLSVCGFSAMAEEATYNMPPMTTEEITLTWVNHGNDRYAIDYILAQQFMEKYPNIKVELINIAAGDYDPALLNLISNDELPDAGCAFYSVGPNVSNKILANLTEYATNDEEYMTKVPKGLRDAFMFDGENYWGIIGMNQPCLVFLDQALFERMNVPMPSYDEWTMEKSLELMETMTDASQGLFGASGGIGVWGNLSASFNESGMGEAGWDGNTCDFTAWTEGMNTYTELTEGGHYVCNGWQNWLDVMPDNTWTGESGRVAQYWDNYWLIFTFCNKYMAEKGIKWVPYFMPMGEGGIGSHNGCCNMFFVSAECEHPREAWELLKWMTWSKESWMERTKIYPYVCWDENNVPYLATETYLEAKARCDESGETMPNYAFAWCEGATNLLPVVNDPELNKALAAIMPDLGYWNDWEGFFASQVNTSVVASRTTIGWSDFWTNVYCNGDYNGYKNLDEAFFAGAVNPEDYVQILNKGFAEQQKGALERFRTVYGLTAE